MNDLELRMRMGELKEAKRLRVEKERFCMKSDIEGLRKIIRENERISCIEVFPKNTPFLEFCGCTEYFYSTDDEEFNKEGRAKILKL